MRRPPSPPDRPGAAACFIVIFGYIELVGARVHVRAREKPDCMDLYRRGVPSTCGMGASEPMDDKT